MTTPVHFFEELVENLVFFETEYQSTHPDMDHMDGLKKLRENVQ